MASLNPVCTVTTVAACSASVFHTSKTAFCGGVLGMSHHKNEGLEDTLEWQRKCLGYRKSGHGAGITLVKVEGKRNGGVH